MLLVMDLVDRSGASAHPQMDLRIAVCHFDAFRVTAMFICVIRKLIVF